MTVKPKICLKCGQLSAQQGQEGECIHCHCVNGLTISEEDPRYLVFLSMISRSDTKFGTAKIVPSHRETVMFNHGDQIFVDGSLFRIVAKTYGREGSDSRFWIKRIKWNSQKFIAQDNEAFVLSDLPPAIPAHVLNLLTLQQVQQHLVLPISVDPKTGELLLLSRGQNFRNIAEELPDRNIVIWKASIDLIEKGIGYFYSDESVYFCESVGFECSMSLIDLDMTDAIDVRFCGQCQERVYLVKDTSEESFHIKKGHCVAHIDRPRHLRIFGFRR